MIDFISEEDVCRSSYLLEYFGQSESKDCGTCDICRKARKISGDIADKMTVFINDEMSGRYTLDDVMRRFGTPSSAGASDADGSPLCISILRRLVDLGAVPPPIRQG